MLSSSEVLGAIQVLRNAMERCTIFRKKVNKMYSSMLLMLREGRGVTDFQKEVLGNTFVAP